MLILFVSETKKKNHWTFTRNNTCMRKLFLNCQSYPFWSNSSSSPSFSSCTGVYRMCTIAIVLTTWCINACLDVSFHSEKRKKKRVSATCDDLVLSCRSDALPSHCRSEELKCEGFLLWSYAFPFMLYKLNLTCDNVPD